MTSIIKIEHLKKKFYDNEVLKDINLEINKGEVVCIIGSSGSGKSTLLRCLNQLEMPTSGNIYYKGENLLDKNCNIENLRMVSQFVMTQVTTKKAYGHNKLTNALCDILELEENCKKYLYKD